MINDRLLPSPTIQDTSQSLQTEDKQSDDLPGYSLESIQLARQLLNLNPDSKREFYHLVLHPNLLPNNSSTIDQWQRFTLKDAYKERPTNKYLVAGLFELPSLNVVYGAPGTLKSFLLADMAICIASGQPWLQAAQGNQGATPFLTLQSPVMWVDFDNGPKRTHERMEALARARNLPIETPISYYSMPTPWLDANKSESIGMLINRAKELGVSLIVIDNLGNISGHADENAAEMIHVMSNLRVLSLETGTAVIAIHHQRKSNGAKSRAGDSLRGHSSIEASLDLALLVGRKEGSEIITIKSTKTRGVDVLPFSAQFTFEHKNNGELNTARFFGLSADDTNSEVAIEKAITASLTDEVLNQTELYKAVQEVLPNVGRDRILTIIKQMEQSKRIKLQTGVKNSRLFSL